MQWNEQCVGKKIVIKSINNSNNDQLLVYRISKIGIGIHKIVHVIDYNNLIYTFVVNGREYLIKENDASCIEVEIVEEN